MKHVQMRSALLIERTKSIKRNSIVFCFRITHVEVIDAGEVLTIK